MQAVNKESVERNALGKKKNRIYYVHVFVVLAFMFGFGYLPPLGGSITTLGMKALGIFLGVLYGWTFMDILLPSLLSFIAIPLVAGTATLTEVCSAGFGFSGLTQVVAVCVIAKYLEYSGLTKWLSHWFTSRKICIGRPWLFTYMLFLCSLVLSILTQCLAAMFITWAVVYDVAKQVGFEKRGKYVTFAICGVTIAASFGATAVPYQICAVMWLAALKAATGYTVNFLTYTICCCTFSVLALALYTFIGSKILRIDVSVLSSKEDRYAHFRGEKMSAKAKEALIVVILFMLGMFIPGIFASTNAFVRLLNDLGVVGIGFILICYLGIRRNADGTNVNDVPKMFKEGIPWTVFILSAATPGVINLLEHSESGVITTMVDILYPVASSLGPYLSVAVIASILLLLTQFAHNMVLGLTFIPIFTPLMASIGANPLVFADALCCALQVSFFTPASSTQAAVCYANTDWADTHLVYKYMLLAVAVGLLTVNVVAIPMMQLLF